MATVACLFPVPPITAERISYKLGMLTESLNRASLKTEPSDKDSAF